MVIPRITPRSHQIIIGVSLGQEALAVPLTTLMAITSRAVMTVML